MRKRIKGLFALVLVFGLFFGALPVEASAETETISVGSLTVTWAGVPEWIEGEENAIESTSDDIQIKSAFSGGSFRIIDADDQIIAPSDGEWIYDEETGYQVPDKGPGYRAWSIWWGKTTTPWRFNIHLSKVPIEYTIAYNLNQGSGQEPQTQDATYDKSIRLSDGSGVSREGYVLKGWNTKADGTGTLYQPGAEVKNLTTEDEQIVTLYAQWEQSPKQAEPTDSSDKDKGDKAKDKAVSQSDQSEGAGSSPPTGDDWNMTGYLLVLLAAAAAMGGALVRRKRTREK